MASILSMSVVVQKGHSLGDDADSVTQSMGHFTSCLDKFMNKDGSAYEWSSQLEAFTNLMNKVALGHSSSIPTTEMSFKDLNSALPGIMESLPAVIDDSKNEVEEEVEEEPEEAEEEPAEV